MTPTFPIFLTIALILVTIAYFLPPIHAKEIYPIPEFSISYPSILPNVEPLARIRFLLKTPWVKDGFTNIGLRSQWFKTPEYVSTLPPIYINTHFSDPSADEFSESPFLWKRSPTNPSYEFYSNEMFNYRVITRAAEFFIVQYDFRLSPTDEIISETSIGKLLGDFTHEFIINDLDIPYTLRIKFSIHFIGNPYRTSHIPALNTIATGKTQTILLNANDNKINIVAPSQNPLVPEYYTSDIIRWIAQVEWNTHLGGMNQIIASNISSNHPNNRENTSFSSNHPQNHENPPFISSDYPKNHENNNYNSNYDLDDNEYYQNSKLYDESNDNKYSQNSKSYDELNKVSDLNIKNTKIGQVQPRFIQITTQGDLFFLHNSTTPLQGSFLCSVNGIHVLSRITTRTIKFNEDDKNNNNDNNDENNNRSNNNNEDNNDRNNNNNNDGNNDDDDNNDGDNTVTQKNGNKPSQKTQPQNDILLESNEKPSQKIQIQKNDILLESNEIILEIELNEFFWKKLLNKQNLYRFGTFSINCGSNVLLTSPTIRSTRSTSKDLPPSLIIGFGDQGLPVTMNYTVNLPLTLERSVHQVPIDNFISILPLESVSYSLFPRESISSLSSLYSTSSSSVDNNNNNNPTPTMISSPVSPASTTGSTRSTEGSKGSKGSTGLTTGSFITIPPAVISPSRIYKEVEDLMIPIVTFITAVMDLEYFSSRSPCIQENANQNEQYWCPMSLQLLLPSDGPQITLSAIRVGDIVDVYYESIDGMKKYKTTTKWVTLTSTSTFDLPIDLINQFSNHHYFKISISLHVQSTNILGTVNDKKTILPWVLNEIYFRFFSIQTHPGITIPCQIPIEHWFLDSKDSIGYDISHIPDYDQGNTTLDLQYKKIGLDFITKSTTFPSFIILNTNKDNKDIDPLVNMKIKEITIHINGPYEFDVSSFKLSQVNENNALHIDPKAVTLQCKSQPCHATEVLLSPRAISFKVQFAAIHISSVNSLDVGHINLANDVIPASSQDNDIADSSSSSDTADSPDSIHVHSGKSKTFASMTILLDKRIKFIKSTYLPIKNTKPITQQVQLNPQDLMMIQPEFELHQEDFPTVEPSNFNKDQSDIDSIPSQTFTVHESNDNNIGLSAENDSIQLIAHIILQDINSLDTDGNPTTTTTDISATDSTTFVNLGLFFQYGADVSQIPSALMATPRSEGQPFWLWILVSILGLTILFLLWLLLIICRGMIRDEAEAGAETTAGERFEKQVRLLAGQMTTFVGVIGKELDQYQPPTYNELDIGNDGHELPIYDPELESGAFSIIVTDLKSKSTENTNGADDTDDVNSFLNDNDHITIDNNNKNIKTIPANPKTSEKNNRNNLEGGKNDEELFQHEKKNGVSTNNHDDSDLLSYETLYQSNTDSTFPTETLLQPTISTAQSAATMPILPGPAPSTSTTTKTTTTW